MSKTNKQTTEKEVETKALVEKQKRPMPDENVKEAKIRTKDPSRKTQAQLKPIAESQLFSYADKKMGIKLFSVDLKTVKVVGKDIKIPCNLLLFDTSTEYKNATVFVRNAEIGSFNWGFAEDKSDGDKRYGLQQNLYYSTHRFAKKVQHIEGYDSDGKMLFTTKVEGSIGSKELTYKIPNPIKEAIKNEKSVKV